MMNRKLHTWKTFDGRSASATFELRKHNEGTPTEWWSILYVKQNGLTLKNKWGGFPSRNCGKPAYIQKIWNDIEDTKAVAA